ncbi:MAG TPA: hypothetical protein VIM65_14075 [Cyclobacteriaceae bacterium]
MNTKLLMMSSALTMGLAGITASFLPHEFLNSVHVAPVEITAVLVQIIGACYLGFAMLNWMSKANLIGGIYNRPVAVGNLLHFSVSALAILKVVMANQTITILWIAGAIYTLFAIWFALVLFTHPVKES